MPEVKEVVKVDGKDFNKLTTEKGTVVLTPVPSLTSCAIPEYKKLMSKEDISKIKTGVMTLTEQQKLLAAIALKLGVIG